MIVCPNANVQAWPSATSKGTTLHDARQAFASFTLFSPMEAMAQPEGKEFPLYLINMAGSVVHEWKLPFIPLQGKLLPNGNVVVSGLTPNQTMQVPRIRMKNNMGGYADNLVELDWDGKTVFQYQNEDLHHDFTKLANGNYLALGWEPVVEEMRRKIKGGFKNSEHLFGIPEFARKDFAAGKFSKNAYIARMFNDYLIEIDPKGKTIWKWQASKHLDPAIDIIGSVYKREEWLHANSIDVLKNGNLLLTSRNTDSIYVIDRKSGKIVQRWGNASYIDEGTGQIEYRMPNSGMNPTTFDETLAGPHDAQQIPEGYPGAGNITIYNNGIYTGVSRVVEFDPNKKQVVAQTRAGALGRPPYSAFMGSAHRLPNGNTLVCEGLNGRLYQITAKQEVVWEYVNPFDSSSLFKGAIYQAHAYAPDYCPQLRKLSLDKGEPTLMAPSLTGQYEAEVVQARQEADRYRTALIILASIMALAFAAVAGRWYLNR